MFKCLWEMRKRKNVENARNVKRYRKCSCITVFIKAVVILESSYVFRGKDLFCRFIFERMSDLLLNIRERNIVHCISEG